MYTYRSVGFYNFSSKPFITEGIWKYKIGVKRLLVSLLYNDKSLFEYIFIYVNLSVLITYQKTKQNYVVLKGLYNDRHWCYGTYTSYLILFGYKKNREFLVIKSPGFARDVITLILGEILSFQILSYSLLTNYKTSHSYLSVILYICNKI